MLSPVQSWKVVLDLDTVGDDPAEELILPEYYLQEELYRVGDRVRILAGPQCGSVGVVEAVAHYPTQYWIKFESGRATIQAGIVGPP